MQNSGWGDTEHTSEEKLLRLGMNPHPNPTHHDAVLTCRGVTGKILIIGIGKHLGQLLVRHVSQLGEVQEVKVDLQRGDTAQGL